MRDTRSPGFTIIELLIAVAILGIISMLAAPSFREFIIGSQVRSGASDLYGSALLARSEAIKRNATITLCRSADAATCATTGGWQQGWIACYILLSIPISLLLRKALNVV